MIKKSARNKSNLGGLKDIARKTPRGRASIALEPAADFSDALLASARKAAASGRISDSDTEWFENSIYLYQHAMSDLRTDLANMQDIPKNFDKNLLRLVMAASGLSKFGNETAGISKKVHQESIQAAREIKFIKAQIIIDKCKDFLRKKKKLTNSVVFANSIKAQLDAKVGADIPVGTIRKRIAEVLAET